MKDPFLIALDGPAGVGKSTVARRLAASLGLAYLDTGAMFRVVALFLLQDASLPQGPALEASLARFSFALRGSGDKTVLLCNGHPAGGEIRAEEVGMMASRIGRLAEVRAYLKAEQQRLGAGVPLVAEGRDMGTAVFPQAACKIFLEASPEIRALRRYSQLRETGQEVEYADLLRRLQERDEEDRGRPLAPLKPAPDALILDTSDLDLEQVFSLCRQTALRAGFRPPSSEGGLLFSP
jgi:cytidylate kinase